MNRSSRLVISNGKMGFEAHFIMEFAITRHFLAARMARPVFGGFD